MGCHTWFYNKISEMPNEHLSILKERTAKRCRDAYIVKTTFDKWLEGIEKDLEHYVGRESKSDDDNFWLDFLNKAKSREYYDKTRNAYIKDAEILENPRTSTKRVLKLIAKYQELFDNDFENGYYGLGDFGWHDKYRVSGYPEGKFKSADEAIKFLEEYDNGDNITYDFKKGMCDEIRDVINNFFREYPKGCIDYG